MSEEKKTSPIVKYGIVFFVVMFLIGVFFVEDEEVIENTPVVASNIKQIDYSVFDSPTIGDMTVRVFEMGSGATLANINETIQQYPFSDASGADWYYYFAPGIYTADLEDDKNFGDSQDVLNTFITQASYVYAKGAGNTEGQLEDCSIEENCKSY